MRAGTAKTTPTSTAWALVALAAIGTQLLPTAQLIVEILAGAALLLLAVGELITRSPKRHPVRPRPGQPNVLGRLADLIQVGTFLPLVVIAAISLIADRTEPPPVVIICSHTPAQVDSAITPITRPVTSTPAEQECRAK